MKSLSPVPEEKKSPAEAIAFLPSWLFFVENIPAESTITLNELREQVTLQLESFAPIPAEQLLSGFVAVPAKGAALCYAAARERCRERLAELPSGTLHCLPAFALWTNADVLSARWEWLATNEELTAIFIEPDNPLPTKILSWPIERETLSDADFYAKLNAERARRQKELGDTLSEQKEGIYLFAQQIIDTQKRRGEIHLQRLGNDGSVVPAARVLHFSLAGESLWDADIRDAGTLARERKERKQITLCKQAVVACGIFAGILAVAQIFLWIFEHKTNELIAKEEAQRPIAQTIRNQAKLIADISKIQENKLQTIRSVAALNAHRPNGVSFTTFSGNGTTGTLSVAGSAESITLANEFEKNLRSCGLFKSITFSANMAANGAHFNLQCTPVKSAFAELDFYETESQTPAPVKEDESAPETISDEEDTESTETASVPEDGESDDIEPEPKSDER